MNTQSKKGLVRCLLLVFWTAIGWNQWSFGLPAMRESMPGSGQPTISASVSSDVTSMARDIVQGVGEVRRSIPQGTQGPVIVFEEYHTSRVGQLQIGVMLLRMHEQYGLKMIGLEGALQRPQPLNATWFHKAGGVSAQRFRDDTAVRMLAEGEINAAEFMTMAFSQIEIRGLEKEDEYRVRPDTQENSVTVYLLGIAEKKLTQSDIRKINTLITEKKEKEALDYIKNADPWTRRQFDLFDRENISTSELVQQIREIQTEAKRLNVQVEPSIRDGLQKTLRFYEVAIQRSATMVNHLANLRRSKPAAPAAMIIGAAHSQEIMDLLQKQRIPCALIRPIAFNPEFGSLSMDEFERKNDLKWARIADGSLGRLLNGNRKPPTIIETPTAQSYASAYMAIMVVSEAARTGKRVPDDVQSQLAGLPGLRIDLRSFEQDGYDTIFRLWLTGTDGREKELWARAGTADNPGQAKSLEEKLLQAIADLGGEGQRSPSEPPSNSEGTGDKEGPGDGRRGDVLISRVGLRSLAVFAESKQKITAVGRISG